MARPLQLASNVPNYRSSARYTQHLRTVQGRVTLKVQGRATGPIAQENTAMANQTPTYVLCADTWTTTGDHTPHVLGTFAFLGDLSDVLALAACTGLEDDTEACAEVQLACERAVFDLCQGLAKASSVSFGVDALNNSWTYVVARTA